MRLVALGMRQILTITVENAMRTVYYGQMMVLFL